jgi:hypothetical protein
MSRQQKTIVAGIATGNPIRFIMTPRPAAIITLPG